MNKRLKKYFQLESSHKKKKYCTHEKLFEEKGKLHKSKIENNL